MEWPSDQPDAWELELQQMRMGAPPMDFQGDLAAADAAMGMTEPMEPMDLAPNSFFAASKPPSNANATNYPPTSYMPNMMNSHALTTSASCPSFTSLYEFNTDELLQEIPDEEPIDLQAGEPGFLLDEMPSLQAPAQDMGYDYVLQMQQMHQTTRMRQYPHQQVTGANGGELAPMQHHVPMRRGGLHMSASFTSLASMEAEHKRRSVSKRKKGIERWHKQQRHKSFDSDVSGNGSPPKRSQSMELTSLTSASTFGSTPEGDIAEEAGENDMVGFSLDEFPTTLSSSETSWPVPTPLEPLPEPQEQSENAIGSGSTGFPSDPGAAEIDMLLSDEQGRANVSKLFDAIRDFDSSQSEAAAKEEPQKTPVTTKQDDSKRAATSTLQEPPATNLDDRVQLILDSGKAASSLSISLLNAERVYLRESGLFTGAKAQETAGSLWLLFHASKCQGCSVAGCDVMRRVVKHCRGCRAMLGKCKDPCNEAKAMLLHHATCRPLREQGAVCAVCLKVDEIDCSHNSMKADPAATPPAAVAGLGVPFPGLPFAAASILAAATPPTPFSPTLKPAPGTSRPVPIQPNPLPAASNSMGLMRPFPHLGCSLALYLEQTSPAFRAEVAARVEKRVTSAAGQDLIQHMQKKTRLRSLEDLRSEARGVVLSELERELHFHMQAVNWASLATKATATPTNGAEAAAAPANATKASAESATLPASLLTAAAAGFAAFYAQQSATPREAIPSNPTAPQATPSAKALKQPSNGRKVPSSRLPVTSKSCESGKEAALAV